MSAHVMTSMRTSSRMTIEKAGMSSAVVVLMSVWTAESEWGSFECCFVFTVSS